MNAPLQTEATTDNTSESPEVYYGRTSDGLLAALVGENAFAMIPAYNGEHYLGHAWKLPLPISEWKRSSFYGHGGKLDGKAAFRARVEENFEHQRQLGRLARRSIPARQAPPWGLSDHSTHYAEGIVCHSTPSHGGFHLDPDRNAHIHPLLRKADGFYEEDCCWAAVAQAFPDLFTDSRNVAPKRPSGTGIPMPGRDPSRPHLNDCGRPPHDDCRAHRHAGAHGSCPAGDACPSPAD